MEAYHKQREDLIRQDRALRVDSRITVAADDVRKRAENIVSKVEIAEGKAIWEKSHEGIPHVFPGMEFLTGQLVPFKALIVNLNLLRKGHHDANKTFRHLD